MLCVEIQLLTALEDCRRCAFLDPVDRRGDGVLWPTDTLWGFRDLGYGWFVSIGSMIIIHIVFALALTEKWFFGLLPDPKLRLHISKVRVDQIAF